MRRCAEAFAFRLRRAEDRVPFPAIDQIVAIFGDAMSQARVNSKAPARAVPEMAAITGFGIVSQIAMALSKNPSW